MKLNEIVHADFRDYVTTFPDFTFDCAIIDPPFSGNSNKTNTGTRMNQNNNNHIDYDDMSERIFLKFMSPILRETYRTLKVGAHFYCFTDWKQLRNMMDLIELSSFKIVNLITWDKKHMGMGKGFRQQSEFIIVASKGINKAFNLKNIGNVLSESRVHKKTHPHEKPKEIIEKLVLNSTNEGNVVLDGFCGTGVVPVVCRTLGRSFVASEINDVFIKVANERLKALEN